MPLLLLVLLSLAAPSSALEPELEHNASMGYACWPVYKDPPVLAPTVLDQKGRPDPRLTRVERAAVLKAARALRKLELHHAKAACPFYKGGVEIHDAYLLLVSSADAAARAGIAEWDAVNLSFSVEWSTVPLSALEKEADEGLLKDGPFAGTCSPPELPEVLFVPASGQAADEEEKKLFALLEKEAGTLRESLREDREDMAELLRALDGRSCAELGREYRVMAMRQRWAYIEHRDLELGKAYRRRLKWEPLPDAKH